MPIEKFKPTYTFTEDRLDQLKQVVPEAFADGKINWEALKEALGAYLEDEEADAEHFGLTWPGKRQARRLAAMPSKGALSYCPDEGVDTETSENVFIEGDNLEVLKLMQKAYAGRVKLIYIDPPYNTGNDLIYKDDHSEPLDDFLRKTGQKGEDGQLLTTNPRCGGRFHSSWLNMIYPRLRLSRNLLRDDGVVFISIDDNEISNLRLVCDEIFGEENFIGTFVINSTPNGRDYGHIAKNHEFCVFYCKNADMCVTNPLPDLTRNFRYKDKISGFNIHPLYNSNEAFHKENRPNLFYPFYIYTNHPIKDLDGDFYEIGLEKTAGSIEVYPPLSQRNSVQFVWRWGKEKSLHNMNKEIIGYKTSSGEYRIVQKMRTDEKLIRSLITGTEYSSRRGTSEVEDLLGGKYFSFPKPLELLKKFVMTGMEKSALMLDIFAGSSTSAEAVLRLNAEDKGTRKYLMIQVPESVTEQRKFNNIAEISKERIRRAAKKIQKENPDYTGDLGFNVFKLGPSQFCAWDDVKSQDLRQLQLAFESTEAPLIDQWDYDTVFYEILLQEGFPLHSAWEALEKTDQEVWVVSEAEIEHRLFICLEDTLKKNTIKALTAKLEENDILVCFDSALTDQAKAQLIDHVRLRVL